MSFFDFKSEHKPAPSTALVHVPQQHYASEHATIDLVGALARTGTSVLIFGAWAVVLGGGVYLSYKALKKMGLFDA